MTTTDETTKGDHVTPPVRMDQSMTIAAVMVAQLIGTFGRPGDSEEELSTMHLVCLSMFLYQLLNAAKHKDKVVGILEAIIVELKDPQPGATTP
jgi:hypothetical protein